MTDIDIAKRIDTLQKQFRGLHHRFQSELNEQQVSVDDVLTELTLLPIECCKEYESLIQQKLPTLEESTRITTLFNRLNPLFTFIDYGLLQHLISNLGSTELKEDMSLYIDEVQEFMRETTVGDIIDHWPGDEESHANYSKLRAKFKDDPKTYTLERLNNFRRKFCSRVRLSEFIFGLISLEPSESFFITWLIPTLVVPELTKSIHLIEHSFYESEHILSISIDQEQLYPLASASVVLPSPILLVPRTNLKPPEVPQARGLIVPTLTPMSAVVKKDVPPKSADDSVNIIAIGWEGASRFAKGIIGPNKDNSLKLWDCFDKEYNPWEMDKERFMKETKEELQERISKCQAPNLVLMLNDPRKLICDDCSDPTFLFPRRSIIGLSVSDLTKSLGHSIWSNAVIVQPFELFCLHHRVIEWYQQHLKSKFIKLEYKWSDIDPKVVSNIPVVPVNLRHGYAELPDRIDWLSPFWDTCLQRMTESAQHTFLRANTDRIKLATSGQKREDSHKPLHEQSIFYVQGTNTSKHSAVSSFLGTRIAGPLGTTSIELHHQEQMSDEEDVHRSISQI